MKRKVLSSLLAVMLVLQVFLPNFIVSASTVNNEIIGEQNDQEKQMNSEVDPIDEIIEDDSLGDVKTENNISEDDSKKEDTVTEEPVSKESEETEKSESTTQNNQESKNNEETDNDTIIENTENTEDIQEIKPDVQMKSMFNSNQSSYQAVLNGDVGSNKTTPLLGAPQKDGQVITQLPWRGTVTAQDYNADYKSVSAVINGKTYTGFVESKYVQRFVTSTSKENAISKNNNLKIYQYPSTLSRVVHTYSKSGSSMEIYKVTDYWYEVHVNINGEKVIGYTDQNSFEKI
ncbi:hypothetical protein HRF87_25655, partial [Bacillus sp. CRN 9]|nr:hypothetical protein [Bacillus sp. CRN 9]